MTLWRNFAQPGPRPCPYRPLECFIYGTHCFIIVCPGRYHSGMIDLCQMTWRRSSPDSGARNKPMTLVITLFCLPPSLVMGRAIARLLGV